MSLSLVKSYHQPDRVTAFDQSSAEILAYYERGESLAIVNGFTQCVDLVDADTMELITSISVGRPIQSLAIHKDILVVVAANPSSKQLPGAALFYNLQNPSTVLNELEVGSLPDAVFFSPNGYKVLVCNEGEPDDVWDSANTGTDHNPEGTISIIHIDNQRIEDLTSTAVTTIGFNNFDAVALRASGVKITGPGSADIGTTTTLSQYLEPEYAAMSVDSRRAYVCLQENSALAVIDLEASKVCSILPFGFKDMGLVYNAFDASDKSVAVDIKAHPGVVSWLQPDGIALLERGRGRSLYILTANEGDAQDYGSYSEEARVSDLSLDATAFPDAATLQLPENLGRLKVTTELGANAAGDYETLHAYGGRSFSIFELGDDDTTIAQVFDSGAQFEQITAVALPIGFNSSNDQNGFKARSDDKGPEPENIVVTRVDREHFAIIALERIGGLMVYNINDMAAPYFVQYINNRNFNVNLSTPPSDLELRVAKDLGPEGMVLFDHQLAISNEVSGTTTVYTIRGPVVLDVHRQFSLSQTVPQVLSVVLTLFEECPVPAQNHSYQWVKDDVGLLTILAGETTHILVVDAIDANDDAYYFALVTQSDDSMVVCEASQRVQIQP